MSPEMKDISLRLDAKLLQFMDQLEDLEEKREKINLLIEQGWFSMSKARYSMGHKQVSALQYASEMEPLVRIHTRKLDTGEAEFQTERRELGSDEVENIGAKEEGLRRRMNKSQNAAKENEEMTEEPKSTKTRHTQHQDPLKWFGILVPQNLKQAQTAFKQVIELSAQIAALQSSVLATRGELQVLMKEKQKMTEAAKN
ncbi:vacuolar ATPase assembly protein VMA22 [Denticeps clupeoides]|uniref:vacuolar ATPase assembly protein VMA22 n=1 Tax=Denticeps clupeoides TaxID=299321 RepID=UPI0010A3F3E2|nr:coiled-coil domain-containing protein 115 [Denticeps clupeoides]